MILYNWLNNFRYFQLSFAIDVYNRRGPSNKMHCQLQPKKGFISLYNIKGHYIHPSLLTRWSTLVLKENMSYGQNASPVTAKEDLGKAVLAM